MKGGRVGEVRDMIGEKVRVEYGAGIKGRGSRGSEERESMDEGMRGNEGESVEGK